MASDPVLLELDLTQGLLESPPTDPLTAWRSRHLPVLPDVVEKLRLAAQADETRALIAHVGGAPLTAAQVEELGAAVEAFADAGKRTFAWTESFGEGGGGTVPFHLAAHFDEIWLQPSGGLDVTGIAAGGVFAKGLLDKLGVEPQIHARHEYKNAPDTVLRETMGDAQREALQRLIDGQLEQLTETLVRRRGLEPRDVRAAITAAPLSARTALDRGLIDALGYRDEAYAAARAAASPTGKADDEELSLVYAHRWQRPLPARVRENAPKAVAQIKAKARKQTDRKVIAVIGVEGGIMLGTSGSSPLNGAHAGSTTISAALRQAGESDRVAAVVLRVDSPGGSYTASDAVHREVLRLREAGTPVVATMGSVAASGGYFVAMGADEIFALPSTITGSIGVFGGKLVVREALRKVGVNQELVTTGHQAAMWSAARPFTEHELVHLDRWLDDVYEDFTKKAAAGRGMKHSELEPLARGRVWTGADAKERGLVDTLGGLEAAIESAASRGGLRRDDAIVQRFPHTSPVDRLRNPKNSEAPGAVRAGRSGLLAALTGEALGAATGLSAGTPLAAAPEQLLARLATSLGLTESGALRLPLN